MGTRGLIGWITADGTVRGSYNHLDSYPDSLGKRLQAQLLESDALWYPSTQVTRWVNEQDTVEEDDRDWARATGLWDKPVSTGADWYVLLRNLQGRLDLMCRTGIAIDSRDFVRDSLFCEWAYLLDERTHEVVILKGLNTEPGTEADYCKADVPYVACRGRGGTYYGCRELWRGSPAEFCNLNMSKIDPDEEDAA